MHSLFKPRLKIILMAAFLTGAFTFASQAQVSTAKMEAVYIYNFTKYINWSGTGSDFIIGVIGDTPMLEEFKKSLAGKTVGNKRIVVKSVSIQDAGRCQMAYIPTTGSGSLNSVLKATNGKNVLVVTQEDLAEQGAGISFFTKSGKLKFKLNQSALKNAGLQTSSNLLSFATVI